MGKNEKVNKGKGITITSQEVYFPNVEHRFRLDFGGREAFLCLLHEYADNDYYVHAHVELDGHAYHPSDEEIDDGLEDDWDEAVRDLFRGCFMNGLSALVLPKYFVKMTERLLTQCAASLTRHEGAAC